MQNDPLEVLISKEGEPKPRKFKYIKKPVSKIVTQKIYVNQYLMNAGTKEEHWWNYFGWLAPQSSEKRADATKNRRLTIDKLNEDGNKWKQKEARTISVTITTN